MNRVIILMYHIIDRALSANEVSLDHFIDALDGKGTCPENSVAVTFDDGFDNMLDTALPVLQQYAIPATLFIPSDKINGTNDWMHGRGLPCRWVVR